MYWKFTVVFYLLTISDREPTTTRWQHSRIYPQPPPLIHLCVNDVNKQQYQSDNYARDIMRAFLQLMWSLHNHMIIRVMHSQRLMSWGYMRLCCHLVGSPSLITCTSDSTNWHSPISEKISDVNMFSWVLVHATYNSKHRTWHPTLSQYKDTGLTCRCAIHWCGT